MSNARNNHYEKGPKRCPQGALSPGPFRDAVSEEDVILGAHLINQRTRNKQRQAEEAAEKAKITLPKFAIMSDAISDHTVIETTQSKPFRRDAVARIRMAHKAAHK